MAKYQKKPVTVEAYQWFIGTPSEHVTLLDKPEKLGDIVMVGKIRTLEDTDQSCHYVCEGDFIVKGNHNDVWAVKEHIFKDTYELVQEDIIEPHFNS